MLAAPRHGRGAQDSYGGYLMLHRTCLALTVALGTLAAGSGTVPAAQATSPTPRVSQGSAASAQGVIDNAQAVVKNAEAVTKNAEAVIKNTQAVTKNAEAVIKDTAGKTIGSLRVEDRPAGKSRLTITVTGLRAGYHGFHVHAKGVCDPRAIDPVTRSPFSSAGAHFTLPPTTHSGHSGDLPNLLVGADGTGEATVVTDRFRVGQLFDADGSSVVVHALPDNHSNVPDRYSHQGPPSGVGPDAETLKAGDSGGRVACGVITGNQ